MAIISSAFGSYENSTSKPCSVSDAIEGDILVAWVWWESTTITVDSWSSLTWFSLDDPLPGIGGSTQMFYARVVGTPPVSITATLSASTGGQLSITVLRNRLQEGNPVPSGGYDAGFSDDSTTSVPLDVTTDIDSCDAVMGGQWWPASGVTAPSGFTEISDDSSVGNHVWGQEGVDDPGLTGVTASGTGVDTRWWTNLALFLPGAAVSGGSETNVEISVTGEGIANPTNGSESTIEVSSEGSGNPSFTSGSETTVEISGETGYEIHVSGGSETTVNVTATGAGQTEPNFTGGSDTTVEIAIESGISLELSGGSETTVVVFALTVFPSRRDITVQVGPTRGGGVMVGNTVTGSVIVGQTRRDRGN